MAGQLNDVNVEKFKEFDRTVRENPALGKCTVKVKSTWHRGTKVLVEVGPMHALGNNLFPPTRRFFITTDDPDVLGGVDSAPTGDHPTRPGGHGPSRGPVYRASTPSPGGQFSAVVDATLGAATRRELRARSARKQGR